MNTTEQKSAIKNALLAVGFRAGVEIADLTGMTPQVCFVTIGEWLTKRKSRDVGIGILDADLRQAADQNAAGTWRLSESGNAEQKETRMNELRTQNAILKKQYWDREEARCRASVSKMNADYEAMDADLKAEIIAAISAHPIHRAVASKGDHNPSLRAFAVSTAEHLNHLFATGVRMTVGQCFADWLATQECADAEKRRAVAA